MIQDTKQGVAVASSPETQPLPSGVQMSDMMPDPFPKVYLVTGEPTSGKTHFASTFPYPLFIDFDGGVVRIKNTGRKFGYRTFNVLADNGAGLQAELLIREMASNPNKHPFKTLVLDSCTTWSLAIERQIQSEDGTLGKGLSLPQYGKVWETFRRMTGPAVMACQFLVIVCHETWDRDDQDGRTFKMPLFIGRKVPDYLPGFADELYHLWSEVKKDAKTGVETIKFYARVRKDPPKYEYLRTNIPGLPSVIEDPSFEKVAKAGGFYEKAFEPKGGGTK